MMNKVYTRYAARTGRPLETISLPDTDEAFDLHNALLFEGTIDMEAQYFVEGAPANRPTQATCIDKAQIIADGMDVAHITSLPGQCTMMLSGPVHDSVGIADSEIAFSATIPGEYTLAFECFPYRTKEIVINAVPGDTPSP